MDRYYIYSNKQHVYNTLINNSILSKGMINQELQTSSLSFLSNHFIFLTCDKLNKASRAHGVMPPYFPVTLEVSGLEETGVKVIFLYVKNGEYHLSDTFGDISEYSEIEDCKGAFVFGQVPFGCVKRIIFENVEDRDQFQNASPDLWFPEELFSTWETKEYRTLNIKSLDVNVFAVFSQMIDDRYADEFDTLERLIRKQLSVKAAGYHFIKGTENWISNDSKLKSNVDGSLVAFMDIDKSEKSFLKYAEEKLQNISGIFKQINSNTLEALDPVLFEDQKKDCENHELFKIITECILRFVESAHNDIPNVFPEIFNNIKDHYVLKDHIYKIICAIEDFYNSQSYSVTVDSILSLAEDYPVLKALFIFSVEHNDLDTLERACIKLSQEERRYCFIMYGLLFGMPNVDGYQKDNKLLESYLERIVLERYHDEKEYLIRKTSNNSTDKNGNPGICIEPSFSLLMSKDEISSCIKAELDDDGLRKLYDDLFATDIPIKVVSSYKNPVEIVIRSRSNKEQKKSYPIEKEEDIEKQLNNVQNIIKKTFNNRAVEFNAQIFKERFDSDMFEKVYSRFC